MNLAIVSNLLRNLLRHLRRHSQQCSGLEVRIGAIIADAGNIVVEGVAPSGRPREARAESENIIIDVESVRNGKRNSRR